MQQRRRFQPIALTVVIASGMAVGWGRADEPKSPSQADFPCEVWPIIKVKCLGCHKADDHQGGLDMSTRAAMLEGGNSGPPLVPDEPDESLMIELIEFGEMPPRDQKELRVSKRELKTLRAWIAEGAKGAPDDEEDGASKEVLKPDGVSRK